MPLSIHGGRSLAVGGGYDPVVMTRRPLRTLLTVTFAAALVGIWGGLMAVARWGGHSLNRLPAGVDDVPAYPVSTGGRAGLPVLWDAPTYSFADQDGRTVTDKDFRGHPYVADFIFTQCKTACPVMTAKTVLLQRKLTQPGLRFVSFSVDPLNDTPAVLKAYADDWHGDPARWRLLSTDPAGLAAVTKGFNVAVEANDDPDSPILHSSRFFLVDTAGQVRGIYDSTDEQSMDKLAADVNTLAGAAPSAAPSAARPATRPAGELMTDADDAAAAVRGKQTFAAMGCLACHQQAKVAPPLANVYGGMVRLDDGRTVWADDAYLHESIVDPNAKGVAGYLRSMPNYRDYLDDRQVADLVAYIRSISTNPPPAGHGVVATATTTSATETAVDPVCHMRVVADPAGPHATVAGKTFYFCSDGCRQKFAANPDKYQAK